MIRYALELAFPVATAYVLGYLIGLKLISPRG